MLTPRVILTLLFSLSLVQITACSTKNLRLTYEDLRSEEGAKYQGQEAGSGHTQALGLEKLKNVPVQFYVQKAAKNRITRVKPRSKDYYLFDGVDFDGVVQQLMPRYFPSAIEKEKSNKQAAKLYFSFKSGLEVDSYQGTYRATVEGAVYAANGDLLFKDTVGRSESNSYVNQSYVAHNVYMKAVDSFLQRSIRHIGADKIVAMPTQPMTGYEDLKSGGRSGTGSAFFINSNGYLITAAHVVQSCSYIDIHNENGLLNKTPVEVVAQNSFLDLAILKSDYHSDVYAKLADKDRVEMGDDIWVFGYPLGSLALDTMQMTSGTITSTGTPNKRSSAYLHFSAPIRSGNSGGVIMTPYGVAGLTQAAINNEKLKEVADVVVQGNMNIGMASHTIKLYLDAHDIDFSEQRKASTKKQIIKNSKFYVTQVSCY